MYPMHTQVEGRPGLGCVTSRELTKPMQGTHHFVYRCIARKCAALPWQAEEVEIYFFNI